MNDTYKIHRTICTFTQTNIFVDSEIHFLTVKFVSKTEKKK